MTNGGRQMTNAAAEGAIHVAQVPESGWPFRSRSLPHSAPRQAPARPPRPDPAGRVAGNRGSAARPQPGSGSEPHSDSRRIIGRHVRPPSSSRTRSGTSTVTPGSFNWSRRPKRSRKMIGDALTMRLELTLDLRLEFLSAHLDGVHASTAQGENKAPSIHPRNLRPFALRDLAPAVPVDRRRQPQLACKLLRRDRGRHNLVRQLDRDRRHREPSLSYGF